MRRDDAAAYLRSRFAPEDRLAVVLIAQRGPDKGKVEQKFYSGEQAASAKVQGYLRYRNANGWDVHASANPLKAGARRRGKGDVAEARWLYLDADEHGDRTLAKIDADAAAGRIPPPSSVVSTSPGRYQVLWRIEAVETSRQEALLRSLARRYGTDRAATDCNRVLRLPGFRSRKRDCEVRLVRHCANPRPARAADFPYEPEERDRAAQRRDAPRAGSPGPRPGNGDRTQSGEDWAWTRQQLRRGKDPGAIEAELAARRPDKSDPGYYARLTVANAQRSLQRSGPER